MAKSIIRNVVLLVNRQFADGTVLASVRGESNGKSVRISSASIPPLVCEENGIRVAVEHSFSQGDPLYVTSAVLEENEHSNYRKLHGKVAVELPADAAPAAPAAPATPAASATPAAPDLPPFEE